MRKKIIGNEFSCGRLFHFLITVSARGKGHMDWRAFSFYNYCLATRKRKHGSHECFFALSMFIWRPQKANTTGGYKSHLCFPIITNWNTNIGLFDSLFVFFPIEWHQKKKEDGIYRRFCFFVFIFLHCELKETKVCISDHISIFLFCLWIRKREKEASFNFSYFLLWIRKTKNVRTVYTAQGAFRFPFFFMLQKKKTKICITDHISIFRKDGIYTDLSRMYNLSFHKDDSNDILSKGTL